MLLAYDILLRNQSYLLMSQNDNQQLKEKRLRQMEQAFLYMCLQINGLQNKAFQMGPGNGVSNEIHRVFFD